VFELSPQDWTAIALSLRVAVVSTLIALPFGIAIATVLARASFWGKSALDALVHLPLVLPPVVTGYLLLITFGRKAPVGAFLADHFGIVFSFRWTGAALACAVMGFPLMVRSIRISLDTVDRRLEEAARTLGAGPLDRFVSVTLPLMRNGFIVAWVLMFLQTMKELPATLLLRPVGFDTLAIRVWMEASEEYYQLAAPSALLIVLLGLPTLLLLLSKDWRAA